MTFFFAAAVVPDAGCLLALLVIKPFRACDASENCTASNVLRLPGPLVVVPDRLKADNEPQTGPSAGRAECRRRPSQNESENLILPRTARHSRESSGRHGPFGEERRGGVYVRIFERGQVLRRRRRLIFSSCEKV